jgi:hypothetical protein
MDCPKCGFSVAPAPSLPVCRLCTRAYHIVCIPISSSRWSRRSKEQQEDWVCDECEIEANTNMIRKAKSLATSGSVNEAFEVLAKLSQHLIDEMAQMKQLIGECRDECKGKESVMSGSIQTGIIKIVNEEMAKNSHKHHSYAGAVQQGLTLTNSAQVVRIIRREEKAQESRNDNLVFTGLDVSGGQSAESLIKDVATELGIQQTPNMSVKLHLPAKPAANGLTAKRSVTVVRFNDKGLRRQLLNRARDLRDSRRFGNVFINPDLTASEREADFHLRQELRAKRLANPAKHFLIRRGVVAEAPAHTNPPAQNSQASI